MFAAPVRLHELVGALRDSGSHGNLKKQLGRIQKKNKVLQVPLAKVQQDRVSHTVMESFMCMSYRFLGSDLSSWMVYQITVF